ncbi:MAG: NUDIX domain-containing protein [Bacteroidia bacterium]
MTFILPHLKREEVVFNDKLVIRKGFLEYRNNTGTPSSYTRLRVDRQDASAVLIYNTESQKIILTRQYRYAIASRTAEPILEIMAGKVDPGEDPLQTGIREAIEECGYRILPGNIQHLASFFASPGYTSEKYNLYFAKVSNADKINNGGGLEAEHESIEVVELDPAVFLHMADNGLLEDGKTLTVALLARNRELL